MNINNFYQMYLSRRRYIVTWMSQKFCNILECACLPHVYHMTKDDQTVEGIQNGLVTLSIASECIFFKRCSHEHALLSISEISSFQVWTGPQPKILVEQKDERGS